jgi:predicted O-methyltransferase YrrM
MKVLIKKLLGERILGVMDFIRFPKLHAPWGGPFNGQQFRQYLFRGIVEVFKPAAIIETGTFLGTTTEFLANTQLPVFSIEENPRNYGFARARLWRRKNVRLLCGDSRQMLRALLVGPLRDLSHSNLFFYLDAHWNNDLPLLEELEAIYSQCSSAVVMIDDFEVSGEPGYRYDDYGAGKVLTLKTIKSIIGKYQLTVTYPSASAAEEGGARRGCVVLFQDAVQGKAISGLRTVSEKFVDKVDG